MTFTGILKKFSVIIVALLALGLTRMGIGYLTILLAIGIIMPIICDNKKSAIFTGILYATLGYLLSYPSSLFLINYMPDRDIPISVSSTSILTNIFLGWIIPVIVAIVICGIFSIIGNIIKSKVFDKIGGNNDDVHHFDTYDEVNQIDTNSLNKKQKKELLFLTPIQKAKNKYNDNKEE